MFSNHARIPVREFFLIQIFVLSGTLVCAFMIGAYSIEPGRILSALQSLVAQSDSSTTDLYVLFELRLPRICMGALVGAGLALAGAAAQGIFRNPLADPALIGVATGAATGGVLWIVFGMQFAFVSAQIHSVALPAVAIAGGLVSAVLVYKLATRSSVTDVPTLLLAGIALNAIGAAIIGLCVFNSDDQQLRDLSFWTLGSMAGAQWSNTGLVLALMLPPAIVLFKLTSGLNAFALGEANAYFSGLAPQRIKTWGVAAIAALTGSAVAYCGVIAFVGLVAPHLVRLCAGPDHRVLLPGSALMGALLLVSADLMARTLVVPAELPVGLVMSLLGGPFFIWLLRKRSLPGGAL